MDISPEINPTTTAGLLARMGFAIDETRLLNSIKLSRKMIRELEAQNPTSERLIFIKKELSSLETRLARVRAEAGKTGPDSRSQLKKIG